MKPDPRKRILVDGLMVHECVGCGACCRAACCWLAYSRAGKEGWDKPLKPCPYLRYHDERWWCGLVEDDPEVAELLYVGKGCCRDLFNEDRFNIPTPADIEAREARETHRHSC